MDSENFIIDRNGKAKSIKETIFRNNLNTGLTDASLVKEENRKASKTIFKLRTIPAERTSETHNKNENFSLKKSKFSTIEDKIASNESQSINISLQSHLPPIDRSSHLRDYTDNYVVSSGQKFKKVECFFRTEMRLKKNIKKSINNKSIVLENSRKDTTDEKIIENKLTIDPDKEARNIVKDLYGKIKGQIDPHLTIMSNEGKRIFKKNSLRVTRRKSDYSVINGKFTYFNLVNDRELMCRIFNENMSHITDVVETFDHAKRQKLLELYKLI